MLRPPAIAKIGRSEILQTGTIPPHLRSVNPPVPPHLARESKVVHPTAMLEVHLLGTVDFLSAAQLQERLVYEISGRNDQQGALLLCEHPPLISIGREGSHSQVLVEQTELEACAVETHWVARGGGALMHAPGQLALYPILPLDRLGLSVSDYRRRLEQTLVAACRTAQGSRQTRCPGSRGLESRRAGRRRGCCGQELGDLSRWLPQRQSRPRPAEDG